MRILTLDERLDHRRQCLRLWIDAPVLRDYYIGKYLNDVEELSVPDRMPHYVWVDKYRSESKEYIRQYGERLIYSAGFDEPSESGHEYDDK